MARFDQSSCHEYLETFLAGSRRYFSMNLDRQTQPEPRDDDFEIVQVIGGFKLLDGMSRERVYWRRDRAPLAPGFYFVKVAAGFVARKFSEDAVFRGPFRRRQEAGDALQRFKMRVQFRNQHQRSVPVRPALTQARQRPEPMDWRGFGENTVSVQAHGGPA